MIWSAHFTVFLFILTLLSHSHALTLVSADEKVYEKILVVESLRSFFNIPLTLELSMGLFTGKHAHTGFFGYPYEDTH